MASVFWDFVSSDDSPSTLTLYSGGRSMRGNTALDLGDHGAQVTTLGDVALDVDAARLVVALDRVRAGGESHVRHVGELDLLTGRGVDREVTDVLEAVTRLGQRPDVDVVGAAASEDVRDLLTCDVDRRLAPNVARFEVVLAGLVEIELDLDLGNLLLQRGAASMRPGVSPISLTVASASSVSLRGSGPKMRTTTEPPVPLSTSLTRSRR